MVGETITGEEIRNFIRLAEQLLSMTKPHRQFVDDVQLSVMGRLIHNGLAARLPSWSADKLGICWKLMLQIRMKRVPPSYINLVKVLPRNQVEVHLQRP